VRDKIGLDETRRRISPVRWTPGRSRRAGAHRRTNAAGTGRAAAAIL